MADIRPPYEADCVLGHYSSHVGGIHCLSRPARLAWGNECLRNMGPLQAVVEAVAWIHAAEKLHCRLMVDLHTVEVAGNCQKVAWIPRTKAHYLPFYHRDLG